VLDRVDCVYVALDSDVLEPSEMAVCTAGTGRADGTELEALLGRIREAGTVVGAGLTGLAADRANVEKLERLTTAIGF
jgi:arginase family enzyme